MMAPSPRMLIAALAGLLCCGPLRAEASHWGFQAGGAAPLGSSRQWIGSGSGPAIDLLVSYPLDSGGTVRTRLGWFAFKANGTAPQPLLLQGSIATYPAASSNTLWGLTYGVEYLQPFHAHGLYALGGAGAAYLNAVRDGTIDLTAAGYGPSAFRYTANNLVPYFCLGLGMHFNPGLALEGRYQWSDMRDQVRGVNALTQGGVTVPGTASFSGMNTSTLSLGLVVTF